ncbi:hypothetical protein FALBO_11204 [Fusarium albosuccineum]|uniref:Uncharacterized protein n=1 Tax=Fusarium albosuccineum TaxID=1237068 RepID=A0A8H4L5G4_9HYPO|nr:hypothetical protein FALBO_11204 [Fusarium albosuccineum]
MNLHNLRRRGSMIEAKTWDLIRNPFRLSPWRVNGTMEHGLKQDDERQQGNAKTAASTVHAELDDGRRRNLLATGPRPPQDSRAKPKQIKSNQTQASTGDSGDGSGTAVPSVWVPVQRSLVIFTRGRRSRIHVPEEVKQGIRVEQAGGMAHGSWLMAGSVRLMLIMAHESSPPGKQGRTACAGMCTSQHTMSGGTSEHAAGRVGSEVELGQVAWLSRVTPSISRPIWPMGHGLTQYKFFNLESQAAA